MVVDQPEAKTKSAVWERVWGLDLRSLAVFRIGLALVILIDLTIRFGDLTAHYTDGGVLPLRLWQQVAQPGYWSLHSLSGLALFQGLLFGLAALLALAMLVGYQTRIAVIASWILLVSLHNRNPVLIFAADDVLRALMFWAMFLPLGACYSVDRAMNTAADRLPQRVISGATIALIVQQCFIYMFSAAFKTKSSVWTEGSAVYYALSFDQYVTAFGHWLLHFPPLLVLFTYTTLVLEWVGPLLLLVPLRPELCRLVVVLTFISLHIGFGLTLNIGIFPLLSSVSWLAFLPSSFWEALGRRTATPERQGLRIYYDADCGFCKKVVHLLRTFLILPRTPLLTAQSDPSIQADMEQYNSWVIENCQGQRYYKFAGIVYVVSLSPLLWPLSRLLGWKPILGWGTRFYETIARNRKIAGRFTRPLQFRPQAVRPHRSLTILALVLLAYATLWNLNHYNPQWFKHPLWQRTEWAGRVTRLDQSWSIFAPAPPRDDGWHVIPGKLQDGSQVDIFRHGTPVTWEKPDLGTRDALYRDMQWRSYFINLNRAIGKKLYPAYAQYLCRSWNQTHSGGKTLTQFEIYFMNERTVPPGQTQTVQKQLTWQQTCSAKTQPSA